MSILRSYTPLVEPIASDEAFLDVAGARRLHGTGPSRGRHPRTRARRDRAHRLGRRRDDQAAGQAGERPRQARRPAGVEPGTELEFLHPLPVRRLWGVGPATERKLGALGVRTVGDLAAIPEEHPRARRSATRRGRHLHALAWNRDDRPVVPDHEVKSIGHEETFPVDLHRPRPRSGTEVVRLADGVASRLRAAARAGRTVQLKVRFADFRTITRSRTLAEPTDLAADIGRVARDLLDAVDVGRGRAPARRLGAAARATEPAPIGHGAGAVRARSRISCSPARSRNAGQPGPDRQAALERSVGRRCGPASVRGRRRARFGDEPAVEARPPRALSTSAAVRDEWVSATRRAHRLAARARRKWERCRSPKTNSGSCRRSRRTCRPPTPSWCSRSPTPRSTGTRPRVIKWSVVGFVAGLVLMVLTFTTTLVLGVVGFVGDARLRARDRAQRAQARPSRAWRASPARCAGGAIKNMLGNAGNRWRDRWGRDDPSS